MAVHDLAAHVHHEEDEAHNRSGERRTRWVVYLTAVMMVGELIVGKLTGSMALQADGLHMGTHVGALGLTLVAYWYARTRAAHDTFSFGTGKVYALAGYTSGVLLALVAFWLAIEGVIRLALFMTYLWLIGRIPKMTRVFQYHGAEHKTVNAYEAGAPLTPASVQQFSTIHIRCGTAFLLWVVVISIIVFGLLGHPPILIGILSRINYLPRMDFVHLEARCPGKIGPPALRVRSAA